MLWNVIKGPMNVYKINKNIIRNDDKSYFIEISLMIYKDYITQTNSCYAIQSCVKLGNCALVKLALICSPGLYIRFRSIKRNYLVKQPCMAINRNDSE